MKHIFPTTLSIIALMSLGFVYAANTIRVTLPQDTSDAGVNSSYAGQELYIQSGAISIINVDSDNILAGDYFTGYYHDTAYGAFDMEYSSLETGNTQKVRILSDDVSGSCSSSDYRGYKLEGYSFNPEFGAMNFNYDANTFVFLCVPLAENSDLPSYLGGNAYSELIGTQYFGGIEFDAFVDRSLDHSSDARFVRVDGVAASQNENTDNTDFDNDIRLVGNIQKSGLRKDIQQNIFTGLRGAPINNGSMSISSANADSWIAQTNGTKLLNDTVLYFGDLGGATVTLGTSSDITGVKTIVVEGGDILINGNIIDDAADNDILGIISLEKEGQGGNILIDASVTDVHAILYADKSLLSSFGGGIADGNTLDSNLRNQLYINGSVFSENTTGGALSAPYTCPFYEENVCTVEVAKKYDLGFLRRYILVSDVDADGSPTGVQSPLNGGSESEMGDGDDTNTDTQAGKTGYRTYPFIIEYNSQIQTTPPPFF